MPQVLLAGRIRTEDLASFKARCQAPSLCGVNARPASLEGRNSVPQGIIMSTDLVLVAKFGAPHGVRGEVRVKSYTQDPAAILDYSPLQSRDGRLFTVRSVRPAGEVLVARIAELTDRNAAEAVTNMQLFVPRERIPPADDEDEFLHADLIGLKVEPLDGEAVGTVTAIYDFGAGDVIDVARRAKKAVMVPFTKAVVPTVDIAGGRIVIDPPEGLLEDTPRDPQDRD